MVNRARSDTLIRRFKLIFFHRFESLVAESIKAARLIILLTLDERHEYCRVWAHYRSQESAHQVIAGARSPVGIGFSDSAV